MPQTTIIDSPAILACKQVHGLPLGSAHLSTALFKLTALFESALITLVELTTMFEILVFV